MCICDTSYNIIDGKRTSCRSHNTGILGVFAKYKILLIYLAVINFIAFVAYAVDKVNAAKHRSRIKIVTLLGLAFVGGSVGSLLAMYLLRHKTRKDLFHCWCSINNDNASSGDFLRNECRMVTRSIF